MQSRTRVEEVHQTDLQKLALSVYTVIMAAIILSQESCLLHPGMKQQRDHFKCALSIYVEQFCYSNISKFFKLFTRLERETERKKNNERDFQPPGLLLKCPQ